MQKGLPPTLGRFALAIFFLLLATKPARAHTLPVSFLQLAPDADYLHLELTFNPFELTFFQELDANHDGRIDGPEWEAVQSKVTERLLDCVKLTVDGKPIRAEIAAIIPDFDSHHATLRAHYPVDARRRAVTLESDLGRVTSISHFTQVTFGRGAAAQAARLDPQSVRVTFEPLEQAAEIMPTNRTNGTNPLSIREIRGRLAHFPALQPPSIKTAVPVTKTASAEPTATSRKPSSVFSLLLAFAPITLLLVGAAFMSQIRRRLPNPSAAEHYPQPSLGVSEPLPQPITSERTL